MTNNFIVVFLVVQYVSRRKVIFKNIFLQETLQLTTLVILHPLFNFSIVEFITLFFEGQAQAVHAQYLRLLALIQHYLSSKIATRISSRYFVFDYFEKILRLDVNTLLVF